MKTKFITLSLRLAVCFAGTSLAQQNSAPTGMAGKVGKETKAAFESQNQKGAAAVSAVVVTPDKLSSTDQDLMMEVARGGMMQLEVSKVALQKASSEEVRQLAQAEVEEQTGLSAKLKEIADAKGFTLPASPDAQTQTMISQLQGMSGQAADRMYVSESGVKGHAQLDKVMSMVESKASDSSLKGLAKAAHPLVKIHLTVSRQILEKL